jgi:hypothetical protein
LKNVFEKIAFKTYPECFRSIEKVTIDGVRKGGGVYITNYTGFAELKVTALRWTINDVLGKTFCVHLRPPCESLTQFCRGPTCIYSVYDPFTHKCCPTCDFIFPTDNTQTLPDYQTDTLPPYDYYYPPSPQSQSPPPVLSNSPPPSPLAQSPPPVLSNNPPPSPLAQSPPSVLPNNPAVVTLVIKLMIKAPTMNRDIVMQSLCPNLETMFGTPCKIIFTSTTGIYYGQYLLYEFEDVLDIIQNNLDMFTQSNGLMCGSTITLSYDDRIVRYTASRNTCN